MKNAVEELAGALKRTKLPAPCTVIDKSDLLRLVGLKFADFHIYNPLMQSLGCSLKEACRAPLSQFYAAKTIDELPEVGELMQHIKPMLTRRAMLQRVVKNSYVDLMQHVVDVFVIPRPVKLGANLAKSNQKLANFCKQLLAMGHTEIQPRHLAMLRANTFNPLRSFLITAEVDPETQIENIAAIVTAFQKAGMIIGIEDGEVDFHEHLSISDRVDPDFQLAVINPEYQRDVTPLDHTPVSLLDNEVFMMEACQRNGFSLARASARLRNMPAVVRCALVVEARALEFASDELKDRRDIVEFALEQNCGEALQFASERLREMADVVELAEENNNGEEIIQYAGPRLRDNFDYMVEGCQDGGFDYYEHASERLKNDIEFATLAMSSVPADVFRRLPEVFRNRFDFAFAAVTERGENLRYVGPELKNNEDITLAAVMETPHAITHAGSELMANQAFLLKAIQQSPNVFGSLPEALKSDVVFVSQVLELNLEPSQRARVVYHLQNMGNMDLTQIF
ncbi:DUF4116 domain-containing protein [Limnobacter parvus]|uniref:DUF4116 domain-containing protein n=1 Tax=Limnobacter parvus TaxID=2939690 RepID=A0ABT1XMT1_9BURK|nr:DUF4116 domain-containing protein [Limnobacter parvus]